MPPQAFPLTHDRNAATKQGRGQRSASHRLITSTIRPQRDQRRLHGARPQALSQPPAPGAPLRDLGNTPTSIQSTGISSSVLKLLCSPPLPPPLLHR